MTRSTESVYNHVHTRFRPVSPRTSITTGGSSREHLAQIAAHGFEAVELFATRSHFDYHDPAAIAQLADWLKETGLALNSVHAPITERLRPGDQLGRAYLERGRATRASAQAAVREAEAALNIARRIPFDVLVVHLGTPAARATAATTIGRRRCAASRRSAGWPSRSASASRSKSSRTGCRTPASLVAMLEERSRRRRDRASASTSATRT